MNPPPVESDTAACLVPPPPHSNSSTSSQGCMSGSDGMNRRSSHKRDAVEQGELLQQPPQLPQAKKARHESTQNADMKEFSVEYRRLDFALAAASEKCRTAAEETAAATRAIREFENSDLHGRGEFEEESGNVEKRKRLIRLRDALNDKSEDLEKKDTGLRFDMLCLKLRHNQFSPSTSIILTDYNRKTFPEGFANRLGQALLQNTQVTDLTFFPRVMLPTNCEWDMRQALDHIDPMLRFVQTSQCLRHVKILNAYLNEDDEYCYGCTPLETFHALLESILKAIATSPSIEGVMYECYESSSLFEFMSTAKKLKSPDIDFVLDTDENRSLVPVWEATDVATNGGRSELTEQCTLERLTLQNIENLPNMAVTILGNLNIWAPALNELTLIGCSYNFPEGVMPLHFWQSLAMFLHSHGSSMLRTLQLGGLIFDSESMMLLLSGLRCMDGMGLCSAVTLCKLSFPGCMWDQEATDALVDWMHTPATNNSGSNTAAGAANNYRRRGCSSSLRELHFECVTDASFGESKAAPTITSMLLLQPPTNPVSSNGNDGDGLMPTIGSQIRTLSLGRFSGSNCGNSRVDVLSQLSRSNERVQLAAVQLDETNVRECRRLRKVLPKLPSIRKLHIGRLDDPVNCRPIVLAMLRENVRLGTFSYDDKSTFTARQLRLATAFQERNQFLGRHFGNESPEANASLGGKADEATTTTDSETGESITASSAHPQRLDVSLYPPLFQVAEPVLASQQWHIPFRGLSMLGESIGSAISDESYS